MGQNTSSTNYKFNVLKDTNGNLQVCTVGGVSAGSAPTWTTAYGSSVTESTGVQWTCIGSATYAVWTAAQNYYKPVAGFQAPTSSDPYGGAAVNDGTNSEFCISTGVSGAGAPTWNATVGGTTTDNTVTWLNNGPPAAHSLSWTKGYIYAYSFKARSLTDYYSTAVNGVLPIPPGLGVALPAPTGSETGGISTASPVYTIVGSNPGAINTVSGVGSTDPQVDTIVIWRTADGGSSDSMFELTEIPAPAPVGGVAQPWSFQDWLPDLPTNVYPGLNTLIPAPIDDSNDPPPAGFLPMAYHFERIWGAVGQFVYCSGGGDVVTGNPNESYDPADYFEFQSPCIRLLPTATGIYNFTTSDVYAILGGPSFTSFYASPAIPGVGLMHYWALDQHGGVIYLFTADKQFVSLDPSAGVNRIGAALGDYFATWNPADVFVTVYESGIDNCVIVSDGSTGWYRLNPSQFPNARPVWSPFATIVGGVSAVQSIQTSAGVHQLLIGTATPTILYRNLGTFEDNGTAYTCSFNMGAINLAFDGQIAGVTFIALKAANTGTAPTVSYLPQELTGSFITLSTAQPYPWQLYGATGSPSSLLSNAYYLNQNQDAALMTFLFVKCAWPAENFNAEIYELTIFGSLLTDE